jgi:peptidoglycan/LPS O-acetylase OafA/YrhL
MPTAAQARRYLAGIAGFSLLGVAATTLWSQYAPVTDVLWGLAFFCLVMYAGVRNALGFPILTWRPLVWVGVISYSIYLIHGPLLRQVAAVAHSVGLSPAMIWIGFELVVAPLLIGVGWVFYRLIESRFVGRCPEFRWPAALRRRFQGRSSVRG